MNKIAKRLVAGASAAALLVSTVGIDQLADLFTKTSYAASGSGKFAQSTGFNNLEQDTTTGNDKYNTGYGLHTNKTATEVGSDGRTFDVDLESWYVGENPVDVATILDASGSMAWTVDTLEPLNVSAQLDDDDNKYLTDHYGNTDLAGIQKANGGYLPQDVVDLILDKTKTDNSKLSYADYMYYIYESRSTVSEFVPLGYWDGGEPSGALKPIGYYKFDGSLKNEITGDYAKYITQESGSFNTDEQVTSVPVEFANGGLDLYKTDKTGNVVIDISSLKEKNFEISFQIRITEKDAACYNTPLVYIGDSAKTDYYALYRGNSNSATSTGSSNKFRIVNEKNTGSASTSTFAYDNWFDCTMTFTYDNDNSQYNISCKVNSQTIPANTENDALKFIDKDFYLILGGNDVLLYNSGEDISKNGIRHLVITSEDTEVANFSLESNLKNSKGGDIKAELMKNAAGSTFNVVDPVAATPMDAKYKNGGLDLNETAKNGAIMLDVVPQIKDDKDGFTISMKLQKTGSCSTEKRNIFYLGDKTQSDYLQFFRSSKNGGDLILSKDGVDPDKDYENISDLYYQGGLVDNKEWYTNTLVFKPVAGGYTVTPYVNGKPAENLAANNGGLGFPNGGKSSKYNVPNSITLNAEDVVLLLGALSSNSTESEHYIKDLYIFDEALDDRGVALIAQNKLMETPDAEDCDSYHAVSQDDKVIAQISKSLKSNPEDGERKGWYYVNSHSNWADISGCLESGKQYLGVLNDEYLAEKPDNPSDVGGDNSNESIDSEVKPDDIKDNNKSIATIPSVYQAAYDDYNTAIAAGSTSKPEDILGSAERAKYLEYYNNLTKGNDSTKTFTPAENERSLQFYIDKYGYLRCFYCTGDLSWKKSSNTWGYSPRTFCSVVYVKEKYEVDKRIKGDEDYGNPTKYEELNYALNQFYQNLAKYSDLSNSAIVRFSTHNLIQGNSEDEVETNAVDHLKMLIMKDWTNYSDVYSKDKSARENYLQNLLIPDEGETSKSTETSSARTGISEYPYVMTGGTYTWTGLKAFYDNMVNTDKLSSGDTVYNIANDARDKYLIIFTDGRDNTIGSNDTKYVKTFRKDRNDKVTSYGDFSPAGIDMKNDKGEVVTGDNKRDAYLARAWADKLKDEGYTIFCVMLATGSISPTTNEEEYNKAYDFLETLAGDKDNERDVEDCISVVGVDNTLEEAFADILTQIQQPRADYTVQDYIDPRFDLVDADGNLYKLGAGGNITIKNADGSTETHTVHNVIEELDTNPNMTAAQCQALGLAYTPQESFMVNRKADSKGKDGYDTGNIGTGYIYYDDVKDMYYLRWTDQIIPMENEAFDTDPDGEYLDVWSATIRLKAKDDFIGGNDILTNGNEAGENLVYSDATIENMDKGDNYLLYGFNADQLKDGKIPYREKLKALSGTDRKINAVDADGVSQAVYGNGIDIPSSGFPRTTVNVRLLPLNANNLNDVIYMGEVVSPTMMLADLENGYMTGSYYLQYLERYAYRVYGDKADSMPLIELLNKWLKINEKEEEAKTFTIPYIYLPDPEYGADGKLATDKDTGKVKLQNSTGWDSGLSEATNFADLNLRDVTGFITYTWKREDVDINGDGKVDKSDRESQQVDSGTDKYDITKDYVVKNTNQIKYNLQLTFTPLKEGDLSTDFKLGENFIENDKFFTINENGEFIDSTTKEWTIKSGTNSNRTDYLQAMIQEKRTYTPHVMYNEGEGKWVLVDEKSTEGFKPSDAITAYTKDGQTDVAVDDETKVTDSGVYDWDSTYKKAPGNAQLEGNKSGDKDKLENIKDYYTTTPNNVKMLNADGVEITDDEGAIKAGSTEPVSLAANTTYTKDVVNAALALELFVDGKYLNQKLAAEINSSDGKSYTFDAVRYYDDPIDPLPYGGTVNADTGEKTGDKVAGKNYRLTFKVDPTSLPSESIQDDTVYRVWAKLDSVAVLDSVSNKYISIDTAPTTDTESIKSYLGYTAEDALPIGTYVIKTESDSATTKLNSLKNEQFKIGTKDGTDVNFQYLKIDNDKNSFTYDKFPKSVYEESDTAAESTKDGDYLIWNKDTNTDRSKANIAESNREKEADTYTLTFNFGTDDTKNKGAKGVSKKDDPDTKNDYAKDRLGIIMLSASTNSLAITKEVKNTNAEDNKNHEWDFTVTIETDDSEWAGTHAGGDLDYTLYNFEGGTWVADTTTHNAKYTITEAGGKYTLTITGVKVKHNQKAVFSGLPEGTWQVVENPDVFCTPHNDQSEFGEDEWQYNRADSTRADIDLTPASQVNYVNEFPYELPSTGGSGTVRYLLMGTALISVGVMLFAMLYFDRRKKARK